MTLALCTSYQTLWLGYFPSNLMVALSQEILARLYTREPLLELWLHMSIDFHSLRFGPNSGGPSSGDTPLLGLSVLLVASLSLSSFSWDIGKNLDTDGDSYENTIFKLRQTLLSFI